MQQAVWRKVGCWLVESPVGLSSVPPSFAKPPNVMCKQGIARNGNEYETRKQKT